MRRAAREKFTTAFSVEKWATRADIIANPFLFKGKVVGVRANFVKTTAEDEGVFGEVVCNGSLCGDSITVSKVPPTSFKGGENLMLALMVKGLRIIKGTAGDTSVPDVEYVGNYTCRQLGCGDFLN
jgi:hypothetical protein